MRRRLRWLLSRPGHYRRMLIQRVLPFLSYLISFLRSPAQAISVWPEEGITPGPRVALFIHFDGRGELRPFVLQYLAQLRALGLSIVFVTNSGRLRPEAMAALQRLCDGVIVRRNIGYDFGAMREGIDQLALPRPDTEMVLLVNDSVYGPLQPLGPLFERIDFDRADIWGLTESWQTAFHLQSFFVAFGRAALTSEAWRAFWRRVRPVGSKWWIILQYEIGLTQRFLRAGLRARALWRYADLVRDVPPVETLRTTRGDLLDLDGYPVMMDPILRGRLAQGLHMRKAMAGQVPLNPTADLWRQLLRSGFPFIKRELLRQNPGFVGDLADWREEVAGCSETGLALIELDLERTLRDRAV